MSKDEHTPERLEMFVGIGLPRALADDGMIAFISHKKDGNFHGERISIIRRAVASWNACKGIETETLESRAVEPCDICGAASHNLRANRAEARADTATALLTEARDFIRAEYNALLDYACLKDESNHPRRDTLDPYAAEHVGDYEALLAKLDEALK